MQDTDVKMIGLFFQGQLWDDQSQCQLIIKSGTTVSLFMDVWKCLQRLVDIYNLNQLPGLPLSTSVAKSILTTYALFGSDFTPGFF